MADIFWLVSSQITLQTSAYSLGLFVIEGQIELNEQHILNTGDLVQFDSGNEVTLDTPNGHSRLLIFKGEPINEPIYHRGPFVMTNEEEMRETLKAYQDGTLISGSEL